jgi:hypothetical protein
MGQFTVLSYKGFYLSRTFKTFVTRYHLMIFQFLCSFKKIKKHQIIPSYKFFYSFKEINSMQLNTDKRFIMLKQRQQ